MCWCVLQLGMLIMGLVALIKGEIQLVRSKVVRGTPARFIGLLLMIPLPAQVLLGFVWGFLLAMRGAGQQDIQAEIMETAPFIDIAVTLGCALVAIIMGATMAKPPSAWEQSRTTTFDPKQPPRPPSDNPYEPPANPFG